MLIHMAIMMKKLIVIVSIMATLSGIHSAYAMRCQQNLVYEGDTKYIVQKKCGEPLSKDMYQEPIILFNDYNVPFASAGNIYEVWTYQSSPNEFLYEVLFEDGRVRSISAQRSNL